MRIMPHELAQAKTKSASKNTGPNSQDLEIIEHYKSNSLHKTAKVYSMSTGKLKRILRDNKINVRSIKEAAILYKK